MEKLYKKDLGEIPKPENSKVIKELAKKSIMKYGS